MLRTNDPTDVRIQEDKVLQLKAHVLLPTLFSSQSNFWQTVPSSASLPWPHGPAGCVRGKLLSLKPFKLLLLLSKQAFIFHEARQGRHYNSVLLTAFSLGLKWTQCLENVCV